MSPAEQLRLVGVSDAYQLAASSGAAGGGVGGGGGGGGVGGYGGVGNGGDAGGGGEKMKEVPDKYVTALSHFLDWHSNGTVDMERLSGPILKSSIKSVYWLFLIQYAALALLGVVLNVIIVVYIMYHRLYKDVTHAFIINLALCHFVQCALVLPVSLMVMLIQNWIFGQFLCFFLPMLQPTEIPKMAPHATLQNVTILKPSEHSKSHFSLSKYPQNQPHSNSLYKYSVTRGSSAEFKENGSSRSLLKHPRNQSHKGVHKSQCPQDRNGQQAPSPKNFTQSQKPEAAGAPAARQKHNAYLDNWRSNWNHTMAYAKKVVLPENPKLMDLSISQGNVRNEVSHPLSMPSTCQPPMGSQYTHEQSVPLDLSCEKRGPPSDTVSKTDCPSRDDDKETAKHANKSHPLSSDHQYAMVKQSPDRNICDMDSFNDMVASEVELRESPSGIFHSSAEENGAICRQLTGTDVPAHVEVPRADGCYVLATENGQPETPVPSAEFTDGLKYQELMSQDMDAEAITFDENSNEQSKAWHHPPESMAWHMDASSAGQRNREEFKTVEHFDIKVEPELPEQIMACASTAGQNNQEAAYCENTSKNPDPEISTYDENIDFVCCCATWLTGMVIALPYPIYTIYVELGDYMPQLSGIGLCVVNLMDDMQEYTRGLFLLIVTAGGATGNGNGLSSVLIPDDSSTSNYGDGEESSVVSSMMVPPQRWPGSGGGVLRHKDVSFSECSSTFSSSTLERDLEIMDQLERERSMDIQEMLQREREREKVRRQLPDIEKLYAQRSPKGKRGEAAGAGAGAGLALVMPGSDPLSSLSQSQSLSTEYSLCSTLETSGVGHDEVVLPHHLEEVEEEVVPPDFYDSYTPGGTQNLPPTAGGAVPVASSAAVPAYQYQYSRNRLSRKSSGSSSGHHHHGHHHGQHGGGGVGGVAGGRGSKRDSFNSLNGTDLIAGAFCELDPTQPLNKMAVIEGRMRRSSPRNASFSSGSGVSGRSSMKSSSRDYDYGHGSSSHSAHPELDFRENIFAEL
ncbi:uncharacterized protein Dyak_GE15527 [Drosophila yakuba]|uniref:G-protein coupled receptors family 1 profile domain-containing protein n=1 Tax=Drosophila yakuba TaxID=7245 RepID=B4Q2Y6_DROYA|nr:uncharacterized protein Dyak_GE15527 [Drosophila yakuba]